MKRFLVALLTLMVVATSVAFAEEATTEPILDLSGYTVDELIQIQREVSEALYNQGGKIVLPSGQLLVGTDIAAGSYQIEPHNVSDDRYSECFTIIVWKSKELMEQYQKDYKEYSAKWDQARRDKYAGKDYEYPQELATSDYLEFRGQFDHKSTARITLSDGNILQWKNDWGVTLDLTIEKAGGLFMD